MTRPQEVRWRAEIMWDRRPFGADPWSNPDRRPMSLSKWLVLAPLYVVSPNRGVRLAQRWGIQ